MHYYRSLLPALLCFAIAIAPINAAPYTNGNEGTPLVARGSPGMSGSDECPPIKSIGPLSLGANISRRIRESWQSTAFEDDLAKQLVYLGEGELGCVYGLEHEGRILAAAKVYKFPYSQGEDDDYKEEFEKEGEALKRATQLGVLYGSFKVTESPGQGMQGLTRNWHIMKFESGAKLQSTKGYKELVPGHPTDDVWVYNIAEDPDATKLDFYQRVAHSIGCAAKWYASS
ncbi:hypothetical protein FRC03_004500 [Tulasnella sp. 419]|nr:hypothetical protein FRC03_004500 [Tulasnella sp. 419]